MSEVWSYYLEETLSSHSVNIVEIQSINPHPKADRLEIIPIGGWQAVVRKGDFKVGDKAVYIEPDYVVPLDAEPFKFLRKDETKTHHRLKAIRLRGALSYGLLIPMPSELAELPVGTDVMGSLGIFRYEPPPPANLEALPQSEWPSVYCPKFDVESLINYPDVLVPGETVSVTEKLDGANARFVWSGGKMHVGSRSQWLRPSTGNYWGQVLADYPGIEKWCQDHPDVILFGEVYGWVQSLRYGYPVRTIRFAAFAALDHGQWLNTNYIRNSCVSRAVPVAPVIYHGPYDLEAIKRVIEEDSPTAVVPGHMMEGGVIVPDIERIDPNLGRVCLKIISNRFWESEA